MSVLVPLLTWLTAVLTAITLIVSSLSAPSFDEHSGARAWFDEPLPGTIVLRQPLAVVGHATAAEGVAQVDTIVDGVVVASETFAPGRVAGDRPAILGLRI